MYCWEIMCLWLLQAVARFTGSGLLSLNVTALFLRQTQRFTVVEDSRSKGLMDYMETVWNVIDHDC